MAKKSPVTKSWSLTIPESLMVRLQEHLFPGDADEHGAVIAAGVVQTPRGARLVARDLFLAMDGQDYVPGERGYRMLRAQFIAEKVLYCREERLAYLAVHCHGGSDWTDFSPDDLASHERGYPALRDLAAGQPVGALVFARNAIAGDIWLTDGSRSEIGSAVIVGQAIHRRYPTLPSLPSQDDGTYDRQARIFGDRGQDVLSKLKVGVIGAGGAGSLIIEYLARLGVGHLAIVDPERMDKTNKPRVVGSTDRDVAARARKVDIAARVAKAANSKIKIDKVFGNVVEERVARHFVDCDYLFLAADTMQARLVFNAIVHQYLIPGIQVGVKVSIDSKSGDIADIFCASRPVTPDQGCLWCNQLISATQLQEEALTEEQRRAQRYVDDPDVVAPSVITLNSVATAHAANHFLFSATGLLDKSVSHDFLRWRPQYNEMTYDQPRKDPDCIECGMTERSRFARGDNRELPTR